MLLCVTELREGSFIMNRAMAAAAGLLVLAGSAFAETRERTIKANTVVAIGGFLG
jgi:hypothetical protein